MRNSDLEDIRVSTKHVRLRIVIFALAVLVAVGAIAYGVTELGRKESGYYRVEATADEELIRLDRSDDKTRFIRPNSIFIDDSFAERRRVKEALGIPVFDLDMVESLLDWRM